MGCPGHLVGERPCFPENPTPKPKAVVFLIHGMIGSANTWTQFKSSTLGTYYANQVLYFEPTLTKNSRTIDVKNMIDLQNEKIRSNTILSVTVQFNMEITYGTLVAAGKKEKQTL